MQDCGTEGVHSPGRSQAVVFHDVASNGITGTGDLVRPDVSMCQRGIAEDHGGLHALIGAVARRRHGALLRAGEFVVVVCVWEVSTDGGVCQILGADISILADDVPGDNSHVVEMTAVRVVAAGGKVFGIDAVVVVCLLVLDRCEAG